MYKFYGQQGQDQFIFEKYFKNKKNGISIECGAFDGILESSTLFFEETLEWNCINIESSPPIFEMLKINRQKSFNFNHGLSNENGKQIFKHVIHPELGTKFGNGSFNHKPEHLNSLINEQLCEFEEYEIETITYTDLIDNFMDTNFKNKIIDLFVLDVEGYEMEVLEGMKNSKYLPQIMCIEYPHVGFDNLNKMMDNLNYKFDITQSNNAYFIKL